MGGLFRKGGGDVIGDLLTSTANEKVRFMRALQDAKARKGSGLMRVEGRKLCG